MKKEPLSKKTGQMYHKVGHLNKILELIYEFPEKKFTVREIANKLKLSSSTVQYNLTILKKKQIVSNDNKWVDNWQNRIMKTNYFIEKMIFSGLVEYIEKELASSTIILFGSFRKGESFKDSDIDIFVECAREKILDLKKFEKKLEHHIELITKPKITSLSSNLLNNIVNGIKIKGYFTIK